MYWGNGSPYFICRARQGEGSNFMKYSAIEFLTTKELAELLRIKERRVYDLAASGEVPCSRATGKLLFPRKAIDQWLVENGSGFSALRRKERPTVMVGSHDPLLEWALLQSRSGLASLFDCSQDGLERFKQGEAIGAGLHIYAAKGKLWNVPAVIEEIEFRRAVLVEWAWRERGFLVAPGNPKGVEGFGDLQGLKIARRQEGAGSTILFQQLLGEFGSSAAKLKFSDEERSEIDCALAVMEGRVDVAFGMRCHAEQFQLDFVPVIDERYDLLVCRKGWFDEPFQALIDFTLSKKFAAKAKAFGGYNIKGQWNVRYNGE